MNETPNHALQEMNRVWICDLCGEQHYTRLLTRGFWRRRFSLVERAIPEDILVRIRHDFGDRFDAVMDRFDHMLDKHLDSFRPRILRCILVASHGDSQRFDHFVTSACHDWRDVIQAGETSQSLSYPFKHDE